MLSYFRTLVYLTIVLLITIQDSISQHAQFLHLWTTPNCEGAPFANSSGTNVYSLPETTPTVYYRLNGLWAIQLCNTANNCNERIIRVGTNTTCSPVPLGQNTILEITRFGDSAQNERKITFFEQPGLQGASFSVDEIGANFTTRTARSYYFTGTNSWEHKPSGNVGVGNCITHTMGVRDRGFGFTYATFGINWQIGSVKYGCTSNEVPNTTTVPTTSPNSNGGVRTKVDSILMHSLIIALVFLKIVST